MQPKISIIIPVIREDRVNDCIASIHLNAGTPMDQYEIIAEVDRDRVGCPKMVARLTEKATGEYVCFLGDDTEMQTDCLKIALDAMKAFPDGIGLVGLNDGVHRNGFATAWLASRHILPFIGGEFFHTGYIHSYCDNELIDRCMEMGRYIYAENARITHNHPIVDMAYDDEHYRRVYSRENLLHDMKLYRERRPPKEVKLGIGIPLSWQQVPSDFFFSFILLDKPANTEVITTASGPVDEMRNTIAWRALEMQCTHLLFLDTDMVFPRDAIPRLLAHNKDIVGALCFKRYPPFSPTLFVGEPYETTLMDPYPKDDLVQVTATGTGCLLIDTRVLMDVPYPWFRFTQTSEGRPVGEDIGFCYAANAAGYGVYVDTSIKTDHLCQYRVNENTWRLNQALIKSGQGSFNFGPE